MTKELCSVSQFVYFQSMHCYVLLLEEIMEQRSVDLWVQQTESLSKQSVKPDICSFLSATLENHIAQLCLLSFTNVKLQQFVTAVFKVNWGHDNQVDGPSKIYQIFLRKVNYLRGKELLMDGVPYLIVFVDVFFRLEIRAVHIGRCRAGLLHPGCFFLT